MSDRWEPRIRMAAERMTIRRMGRERNDETEDDEAWDEEYAQALADASCDEYEAYRERCQESARRA